MSTEKGMIRVGVKGSGNTEYVLLFMGIPHVQMGVNLSPVLTPAQAADLYAQLGALLPTELLNTEPFSSDPKEVEASNG